MTEMREVTERRMAMLARGFEPLPVRTRDKATNWRGWPTIEIDGELVRMWETNAADSMSTAARCGRLVVLDVDVRDQGAVDAVEAFVREKFGDGAGKILRRVGQPPKCAFLFRNDEKSFGKMLQRFDPPGPDGKDPGIEVLAKGQYIVVDGIHPDTGQPYAWTGGEPWTVSIRELPVLTEATARALLDVVVGLMVGRGFTCKDAAQRQRERSRGDAERDDAAGGDLPLMLRLATRLWGVGREGARDDWRFGTHGSKSVDLKARIWFDFETGEGGGARDLMNMVRAQFGETDTPRRIDTIDMTQWDAVTPPAQEWAVHERVPLGCVCLFSGAGAAGKSYMTLQQCLSHVLGMPWLGNIPVTRGPAVFLDAEDDAGVIHRRLAGILRHYSARFEAVARNLHVASLLDEDPVIGAFNRRTGRVEPTLMYGRLMEMAGDIRPVTIAIASSANVFAGSEIDRSQVQQFVDLLTRVARRGNCGVVLISHPSLVGLSSGSGLSGSTQWHNAVRARFYVKPSEDDDDEARGEVRTIELMKNNYGPPSSSVRVRYANGVFVPVTADEAAAAERRDRARAAFLAILGRYNRENRYASANPGPTYAPTWFAHEQEAVQARVNSDDLEAAMRDLLAEGKIVTANHGTDAKPRWHLVVAAAT